MLERLAALEQRTEYLARDVSVLRGDVREVVKRLDGLREDIHRSRDTMEAHFQQGLRDLKGSFVSRSAFLPTQYLLYGLVALILTFVITRMLDTSVVSSAPPKLPDNPATDPVGQGSKTGFQKIALFFPAPMTCTDETMLERLEFFYKKHRELPILSAVNAAGLPTVFLGSRRTGSWTILTTTDRGVCVPATSSIGGHWQVTGVVNPGDL